MRQFRELGRSRLTGVLEGEFYMNEAQRVEDLIVEELQTDSK